MVRNLKLEEPFEALEAGGRLESGAESLIAAVQQHPVSVTSREHYINHERSRRRVSFLSFMPSELCHCSVPTFPGAGKSQIKRSRTGFVVCRNCEP